MLRTLILIVATVSIILVGYGAYTYQERPVPHPESQFPKAPATQPMPSFDRPVLSVSQGQVPGGTKPYVVVYDNDGEPRYQFRAAIWEPVSEVEFRLVDPEICVFMPGGEITRVKADHGHVVVERSGGNNVDPKRGHFQGHVMIFIDRTDKAWRRANPELADPEEHPERVVKIWLDEIRFDLDQSHIKSNGTLRVQSTEVEIEGKGLTLAWNERDNRIEELIIEKGKFMELRRGGSMISFDMPGQERDVTEAQKQEAAAADEKQRARQQLRKAGAMAVASLTDVESDQPQPSAFIRHAVGEGAAANQALSLEDMYPSKKPHKASGQRTGKVTDKPATPTKRIRLVSRDRENRIGRQRGQIDTYLAVFENDVVVEQRRGLKMLGRLAGVDRLEMIFDVGQQQRSALRGRRPTSQPANEAATTRPSDLAQTGQRPTTTTAPTSQPEDQTRIRLMWNGRLVLRPVEPEAKQTGERFDIRAFGPEIRIMSQQGLDKQAEVVCRQLVFSNETEQVWLYGGGPKDWVRMWSGDTRRLNGQEIYLHRKAGIAVVNGPGTMLDTREALADIAIPGDKDAEQEGKPKSDDQERVEITWTRQVELDFDTAQIKRTDPTTGREVAKRREYVKQAAFRGGVVMRQADQHIKADEIVMTLGVPETRRGFVGPIQSVKALHGVTLNQPDSEIRSDKLDVTMTVDQNGRNVPTGASAYGNVMAKQGDRFIKAKDLLSVVIGEAQTAATAPATTTRSSREDLLARLDPERIEKLKRRAALLGIKPTEIDALLARKDLSVEVIRAFARANNVKEEEITRLLAPKRNKPRLAIVEMHGFGEVVAVDASQKLDVEAQELHCKLHDGKTIDRATIVARPGEQARAELGDYIIHGPRIEIDLQRQFAEVPDKGWLRFVSGQGLDGRQLDSPQPMKIEWSEEMRLEGRKNVAWFVGDVVATSEKETSRLECNRLRIDFVDLSPAEAEKSKEGSAPSRREKLEKLLRDAAAASAAGAASAGAGQSKSARKPAPPLTPAKAMAIYGMVDKLLTWRAGPKSSSSELSGVALRQRFEKKPVHIFAEGNVVVVSSMYDKEDTTRLLSRMRMAGPKLSVDLPGEKLDILGAGSLLIEDYRLPKNSQEALAMARSSRPKDPLMGDLSGRGPSQTVFSWANSMTYFLENNLAILDRSVSMIHLGGGAMVMAQDLAKAMRLDVSKLRMKGRQAALTCDNLTVEFLQNTRSGRGSTPFDRAGAAELKRLIATGNIYMEDSGRSLIGEELTYRRDTNEITVNGTGQNMARLFIEDPKSGQMFRKVAPWIRWNRNSGEIVAPGARIDNVGR